MFTSDDVYTVGVTGDWHHDLAWAEVTLNTFFEYGVAHVFQLGDFGFDLDNSGRKYLYRVNQQLSSSNQWLWVTLGNHENYTHFLKNAVEHPDYPGWLTVQHYDRVLFGSRGARLRLDNVEFVSMGGANSIDRANRVEGKSWWREEQISPFDVACTVAGGKANVMLTHDCPAEVDLFDGEETNGEDWSLTEVAYASLSRDKVSEAVKQVQPDVLFHGHYHFYADHVTPVKNNDKELFKVHTVGLDMNRSKNNMALLYLDSLTYELVPPSLSAMKLVRRGFNN